MVAISTCPRGRSSSPYFLPRHHAGRGRADERRLWKDGSRSVADRRGFFGGCSPSSGKQPLEAMASRRCRRHCHCDSNCAERLIQKVVVQFNLGPQELHKGTKLAWLLCACRSTEAASKRVNSGSTQGITLHAGRIAIPVSRQAFGYNQGRQMPRPRGTQLHARNGESQAYSTCMVSRSCERPKATTRGNREWSV